MTAQRDKLVRASVVLAGAVFSVIALAMLGVVAGGVKDSEVAVVTLYTLFTGLAALASIAALVGSQRWAPAICVFAAAAATSAYVLEDALRSEDAAGAAFALVTVPLLIAVLVAVAVIRERQRSSPPRARLR